MTSSSLVYSVIREETEIEKTAREMLKRRMYIPGWLFYDWLKYNAENLKAMVLCYYEDKPVGLGILHKHSYPMAGIFVRDAYRRMGIGSNILRLLSIENGGKPLHMDYGNVASRYFYLNRRANGVELSLEEDE